jgi:hypothetical protein
MWQYQRTEISRKRKQKRKEIQEFMHIDITNVEHKICDHTSCNWSHWNSNEGLKRNLEAIPGKHSTDSLQKTAILGTSHIIRKVLQSET